MLFADLPAPPDQPTTQPTAPKPGGVQGMVSDPSFLIWSGVLVAVLLLAAVFFMFFDRWRKRPTGETTREAAEGFGSFRQMYENGEITEAEYDRIRAKMAEKMKAKMGIPGATATTPPPPAPPPDPPSEPPLRPAE